jgi:formylglycine-generating enzyme required for sulfatase activity
MMQKKASKSVLWGVVFVMSHAFAVSAAEQGKENKPELILTNSIGMELKRIEPGSFMMGSDRGDIDEKPVHEVKIAKPFYIGVYELTQEQYEKVMGTNPSRFKEPKRPVENVSWADAKAFCRKLSEMEKAEYRLPTEAEWEYACRAGTQTVFYWGDNFDTSYFRCAFNSGNESRPVGTVKPNAWGLYDMSGNVWEWCEDWYADRGYTPTETTDPTGPKAGSRRVVRGGSWCGTPEDCRSANRLGYAADGRLYTIGFRVCMSRP